MANKELAKLFVTLGMDDKDFVKGANKFQKTIKTWSKELLVFGAAITAALGFAAKAAVETESTEIAFRHLAETVGESADDILEALRKASAGTVNSNDLMLAANKAMTLGVAQNVEQFTSLMEIARDRARSMGLTTTQAFDNIVTGIGRGSALILDNLGIIVDLAGANAEYAATLNKTASQLTETEKKQALLNAVLKQGQSSIDRLAQKGLTASEAIQALEAVVQDLKVEVGSALLPILKSLLDKIIPVIQGIQQWAAEHPRLSGFLTITTAAIGLLLTALGMMGMMLPMVAKGLTTIITLLHLQTIAAKVTAAAVRLLSLALITSPWGVAIAAVALLGGAIFGLTKLFGENTAAVDENADAVDNLTESQKIYARVAGGVAQKVQNLNDEIERNNQYIEELKKKIDAVKDSSAGYGHEVNTLENQIANANAEINRAKTKLAEIQTSYDDAAEKVKGFETAIEDANSAMDKLTNPRLQGMQAYEDKIFDIDQQLLLLRRQENMGGESEALTAQMDALKKQRELLEIDRDLSYNEILRQGQETIETAQGLNEEMEKGAWLTQIEEAIQQRALLTADMALAQGELAGQNEALTAQQGIVAGLEETVEGYQDRLSEIKLLVENETFELEKQVNFEEERNKLLQERIEMFQELQSSGEVSDVGVPGYQKNYYNEQGEVIPPPVMDTAGIVRGPGTFAVGPGVVEVVRRYNGASGGAASSNVIININNPVVREEADIKKIALAVSREQYRMTQGRS